MQTGIVARHTFNEAFEARYIPLTGTLRVYLRSGVSSTQDVLAAQRERCRQLVLGLGGQLGVELRWDERHEYRDVGSTDSRGIRRAAMSRLVAEVQRGDVIVMRDLSRISADLDEVRATVGALCRDRGALLFCAENGRRVLPEGESPAGFLRA